MTENEAIKELNERIELIEKDYKKEAREYKEVLETAVKALTEIKQYRAIGTIEEYREARERQKTVKNPIARNEQRKIYMCQCGNTRITTMDDFCCICGRAFSWERDDE